MEKYINFFSFFYRWCHPCKLLATKLDDIVGQKNGLLELAKVDIDNNADLALEYEVSIFR